MQLVVVQQGLAVKVLRLIHSWLFHQYFPRQGIYIFDALKGILGCITFEKVSVWTPGMPLWLSQDKFSSNISDPRNFPKSTSALFPSEQSVPASLSSLCLLCISFLLLI